MENFHELKKFFKNIVKFLSKVFAFPENLRIIPILARRKTPWKGGRVVECTALERRHTVIRIEGSNPSPSARIQKSSLRNQTAFSLYIAAVEETAECLLTS